MTENDTNKVRNIVADLDQMMVALTSMRPGAADTRELDRAIENLELTRFWLKKMGHAGQFDTPVPVPAEPPPATGGVKIKAPARYGVDVAHAAALRRGAKDIDGKPGSLFTYLRCLYQDAAKLGINADVLAAQFDLETDSGTSAAWVNSGNPAGIGMSGGISPYTFTPETAARAHAVHMAAYADITVDPAWVAIDPRWGAVLKAGYVGTVSTTNDLGNGRWADDPEYAAKLLERYTAYFGRL